MADKSQDRDKPKKEAEKKQPETVLMSAEELRAISGGATVTNPNPKPPTG